MLLQARGHIYCCDIVIAGSTGTNSLNYVALMVFTSAFSVPVNSLITQMEFFLAISTVYPEKRFGAWGLPVEDSLNCSLTGSRKVMNLWFIWPCLLLQEVTPAVHQFKN